MNADTKIKWLEALRSGKYQQGKGNLRNGDSYCCLGVLCDAVAPSGWRGSSHMGRYDYPSSVLLGEHDLNLSDIEPYARMNDSGVSFAEIADHIEKDL